MAYLTLKILDANGNVKGESSSDNYVSIVYKGEYQEGDQITLSSSGKNIHMYIQVDDSLGWAFCYVTDDITYQIPFGEKKISYSPKTFSGELHYLSAKVADEKEVESYRNLAQNVIDQHFLTGCFPHVWANVETRGEAVFAASNAIDGLFENRSHGKWPYQSWGINRRDDAEMTVSCNRMVAVDKIVLVTRADFPHDNWWEQATLEFSDGESMVVHMEKSYDSHVFTFPVKETSSIKLCNMIKANDPSPFPALT